MFRLLAYFVGIAFFGLVILALFVKPNGPTFFREFSKLDPQARSFANQLKYKREPQQISGVTIPRIRFVYRPLCSDLFREKELSEKGPVAFFSPRNFLKLRKNHQVTRLRVFQQNFKLLGSLKQTAENGRSFWMTKPYLEKQRLAERIHRTNPDVIVAEEIMDQHSADQFIKDFLNEKYNAILIEGNDLKGKIDICFFVKKDFPFDLKIQSHKFLYYDDHAKSPVFTRDLPILQIFPLGTLTIKGNKYEGPPPGIKPLWVLGGVHFRSQLTPKVLETPIEILNSESNAENSTLLRGPSIGEKVDFIGEKKRRKEAESAMHVLENYETQFPGTPMALIGDFNRDLTKAPEFDVLFAKLKSGLDLLLGDKTEPIQNRKTNFYMSNEGENPQSGEVRGSQIDGGLFNDAGAKLLVSQKIIREIDSIGNEIPDPKTRAEMKKMGSDHYGILFELLRPEP